MAILNNSNAISSGGYDINNSLRLRRSVSAYLNRTPGSAGNQKTWTLSIWLKRGELGSQQGILESSNPSLTAFSIGANNALGLQLYSIPTSYNTVFETAAVFRDPSAWYHIVLSLDTTQASPSNMVKMYVNGVSQTITITNYANPIAQNTDWGINSTTAHRIGYYNNGSPIDGYLAETYLIDGQVLTPSSFGETDTTTGSWKPKAYTGTYGTNGFYLKFSDIATTSGSNAGLGKDFSGNANYWTTNNISVTAGTTYDAMTDSPTLTSATVANYPTLNPLSNTSTLTEANLTATNILLAGTTMATPSTGKYYFEYTQTTSIPSGSLWVGVASNTNAIADNQLQGYAYASDGRKVAYNSYTSGYGATWTNGDVIGCALDLDNQTITFYKNNTSQGTAFTSITAQPYVFALSAGGAASTKGGSINCGQRPFAYTPPTGFVRLNTYNLPDSTIKKGNTVMDATLYTGTGSSQSISGLNFQPDLVWVKGRSGATDNALYDAVRGVQLQLESNTTTDQTTETTGLTAFNSNGFTVGALAQLNTSSATYVGWSWKETATSGFDIVTYTGNGSNRTISHSLGVAPKMIIVKARTTASTDQGWAVYHSANTAAPETDYLLLNSTAATADLDTVWNDTAPTSSVFSVGTNALVNTNNDTYVAYCWAEIAGFSKFGSYTGNGSTDGPFVYTGFRPKFIMAKNSNAAGQEWTIYDTARSTYNQVGSKLSPTLSDAEVNWAGPYDILSNGFKLRTTDARENGSTNSIIYMAFAENPLKNSLAR